MNRCDVCRGCDNPPRAVVEVSECVDFVPRRSLSREEKAALMEACVPACMRWCRNRMYEIGRIQQGEGEGL